MLWVDRAPFCSTQALLCQGGAIRYFTHYLPFTRVRFKWYKMLRLYRRRDILHVRFWMYLSWLAEEHASFAVSGVQHNPTLVCKPTVDAFQAMFNVDSRGFRELVSICNVGGLFSTLSRQIFEPNYISAVIEWMTVFIDEGKTENRD